MDEQIESADIAALKKEIAELKEKKAPANWFENVGKLLATLIAVATIIIGFVQYRTTTENEFRKTFWSKQFELYDKACTAAATIAKADDIEQVKEERKLFWQLYWGSLSMVEHKEVKIAMVNYGEQLKQCESKTTHPSTLLLLSYELARACRLSLAQTWNPADLKDIDVQEKKPASTPTN